MASPTVIPKATALSQSSVETKVSPLLKDIQALNFVAGMTTVEDLNRSLGAPQSQNVNGEGVKEYNYSNLPTHGFGSLTAFVSQTNSDVIDEILLGSEIESGEVVSQLGLPKMMLIVPDTSETLANTVPDVIHVVLWFPNHGIFLQITCNSLNVNDCRHPRGEGYGFLFLFHKNVPIEKLEERLLRNCPKCSLIEMSWDGFAKS